MKPVTFASYFICFLGGHFFVTGEKGTTLEKITCTNVAKLCTNLSCTMVPISRFVTNITVGCTLTKPITKVMVRVINYERTRTNKYRKNLFDQTFDFCDFVSGAQIPLVRTFMPNLPSLLGDLHRPCPLTGEVVAKNLTIDGRSSLIYGNSVGYRSNITVMNEKMSKVFTLTMFGDVINDE